MGWLDEKLEEIKKNAQREIESGAQNLSVIVREQVAQQAQGTPQTPVQVIQAVAKKPASKVILVAAIGIGAFFLFKSMKSKKRGK